VILPQSDGNPSAGWRRATPAIWQAASCAVTPFPERETYVSLAVLRVRSADEAWLAQCAPKAEAFGGLAALTHHGSSAWR